MDKFQEFPFEVLKDAKFPIVSLKSTTSWSTTTTRAIMSH